MILNTVQSKSFQSDLTLGCSHLQKCMEWNRKLASPLNSHTWICSRKRCLNPYVWLGLCEDGLAVHESWNESLVGKPMVETKPAMLLPLWAHGRKSPPEGQFSPPLSKASTSLLRDRECRQAEQGCGFLLPLHPLRRAFTGAPPQTRTAVNWE